jgi:hypothetical protein
LKHRVHAVLLTTEACPVSDLFGGRDRQLLAAARTVGLVAGTIVTSRRRSRDCASER